MSDNIQVLPHIESGDTGVVWYGKVNDNFDLVRNAINLCSPSGHNHNTNYAQHTHGHDSTDIITSYNGQNVTVQDAVSSLYALISGLVTSASISGITVTGSDSNSSIININIDMTSVSFGVYSVSFKWSTNPTDTDFSLAKTSVGSSSLFTIQKPSSGWDGNGQLYLHTKAIFKNMANQAGNAVYSHNLVSKYNKDITVEELVSIIENNETIKRYIATNLNSRIDFKNDIAVIISGM